MPLKFYFFLVSSFILILVMACSEDCGTNDNSNDTGVSIVEISSNATISNGKRVRAAYNVLVTDDKGNPLESKRIDWLILNGDGRFYTKTTVSSVIGRSLNTVDPDEGNEELPVGKITVKASVFGYDASVEMTVEFK